MIRVTVLFLAMTAVCIASCGKNHENLPTGFEYDPPPTPSNVQLSAGVESATLTWSYPAADLPTLKEFRIYYYYSLYDMVEYIDSTTDTFFTDTKLIGNVEYCYQVSAVDTSGLEGWRAEAGCVVVSSGTR